MVLGYLRRHVIDATPLVARHARAAVVKDDGAVRVGGRRHDRTGSQADGRVGDIPVDVPEGDQSTQGCRLRHPLKAGPVGDRANQSLMTSATGYVQQPVASRWLGLNRASACWISMKAEESSGVHDRRALIEPGARGPALNA